VLLDGKEASLNFFQGRGRIVDHAAIEADFYRQIGHNQILAFMAIQIFGAAQDESAAATEIAIVFLSLFTYYCTSIHNLELRYKKM